MKWNYNKSSVWLAISLSLSRQQNLWFHLFPILTQISPSSDVLRCKRRCDVCALLCAFQREKKCMLIMMEYHKYGEEENENERRRSTKKKRNQNVHNIHVTNHHHSNVVRDQRILENIFHAPIATSLFSLLLRWQNNMTQSSYLLPPFKAVNPHSTSPPCYEMKNEHSIQFAAMKKKGGDMREKQWNVKVIGSSSIFFASLKIIQNKSFCWVIEHSVLVHNPAAAQSRERSSEFDMKKSLGERERENDLKNF